MLLRLFFAQSAGLLCWILLSGAWLAAQQLGGQREADMVLHDGKILTVDSSFSNAQAIAIRGPEIVAVGQNQDVLKMAGPGTVMIDLKGKTVIPGLIDTHNHIDDYAVHAYGGEIGYMGMLAFPIDWGAVASTGDVLNQIRGTLEKYQFKPGEWIYFASMGGGGNENLSKVLYDGLTRWELDKVTPNNPIVLSLGFPNMGGVRVNSKAIDSLWAKHSDFIKKYGRLWIDVSGRPEGLLESPAGRLALAALPQPAPEIVGPLYKKYVEELNAEGVTTISTRLPTYAIEAFKLLESKGELRLRLPYGLESYFGTLDDLEHGMKDLAKLIGTGTDRLWVISGSVSAVDGSSTRACNSPTRAAGSSSPLDAWWPNNGQCNLDIEYRGGKGAPIKGNYFKDWIMASGQYGFRFANTHVAGDRSVNLMLSMIEQIRKQYGSSKARDWAFDHCWLVDPADLKRAVKLGVMFSCYIQVDGMAQIAQLYGDKVANTFAGPVKSMMDAGVRVAYESDGDKSKWRDFELFLTRRDRNGKVWGPQERLDRASALRMFTRWGADYVLKGDKIGSLEAGKLADLAVLDRDFMTIPAEEFHNVHSLMTMLDGQIVFSEPQFAQENNLKLNGAVVATLAELKARRKPLGVSRR